MDADSPAQVKVALRKLLKKASNIDSVERVNDAKIKQDLRQRIKSAETDTKEYEKVNEQYLKEEMSSECSESMKKVLADTFTMYFMAHAFHWNVKGADFSQYHAFFSGLYTELFAAVDPIAEQIRALDDFAPISLSELLNNTRIMESRVVETNPNRMLSSLQMANALVLQTLEMAFADADAKGYQGLADFITARIDVHSKHKWMLKATMTESRNFAEALADDADAGDYVKDFKKSDAPQFKGKSDNKRQSMAIAAYLAKKRG